ncbi:PREDICTED: B3 domain-containing [Prunus dulcis]|uniref:PREDICTED: B3 domain-containing n=1 Tax=Prunus dulcis TaxID=3755 RepID=A0A5E4GF32_PRUDU|nr:PREDICTED: B3 domain-containing [Prunus dulcis]
MAPSPRQKIDLDHEGPNFSATTPQFLNMILNETSSRDKKLKVPKTFLDKYGEHLSDQIQIQLKFPNGSERKIKLRRCNGEMEETNEEDDDKSIEGLESLEYFPLCPKTQIEETGLDDDNKSVENLEYFPLCPKTKHTNGYGPLPSPLPQEKNRTNPHSSSKSSSSSSSSLRVNVKAANKFLSSHPFFKVTLGPSLNMVMVIDSE